MSRNVSITGLFIIGLAWLPVGCASQSDIDEIRSLGHRWMAAYSEGNYDAIPQMYTEDAWIMPRGRQRMVGREELRRSLGGFAKGRDVDIQINERELVVEGDVAWLVSDFEVHYGGPDESDAEVSYGRSLIIYRKGTDGVWRIHRDIDSPAPAPDQKSEPRVSLD